jgi:mannose-6-phosphate isomerase-like protein (cupin superfamily)
MRHFSATQIASTEEFFQVLATTDRSQVAIMNLAAGQTSGEYGTDHPHADQVLLVLEGSGSVRCGDEERDLATGDLVVIPAGLPHQVAGGPMRSLNFYGPVAYPEA